MKIKHNWKKGKKFYVAYIKEGDCDATFDARRNDFIVASSSQNTIYHINEDIKKSYVVPKKS